MIHGSASRRSDPPVDVETLLRLIDSASASLQDRVEQFKAEAQDADVLTVALLGARAEEGARTLAMLSMLALACQMMAAQRGE